MQKTKKKELEKTIDQLVCDGLLPIAYYKCDIFFHEKEEEQNKEEKEIKKTIHIVSPFFKQYNLPKKESEKLISKIYELY